uniref:FAD/NAD(P)-binding domain-containing protein n=1 Tax=Leptocylindrus danicus TaxID=163516 RepID=A0A7S2P335_9STRA|mmetsp:Transcript_22097/g.33150  ORF Transcript_22097/g.33150 Transcript_22097/m.33150 type:complete len:515 (+) Transcript_22097:44-1588(+)
MSFLRVQINHRAQRPRPFSLLLLWMACLLQIILPQYSHEVAALSTTTTSKPQRSICVIGGGASGMFAATAAAEALSTRYADDSGVEWKVTVLEATGKLLSKVKISGGGRCNVLHDTSKPVKEILESYPRGRKELIGLFNKRFSPQTAEEWFTKRGVELKTEEDGRMFPVTDSSQTIIDTITQAAQKAGVVVNKESKVLSISSSCMEGSETKKFLVMMRGEEAIEYDAVVLATGSSPVGHKLAVSLGHKIVNPVPSLFTLSTKDDIEEGGLFCGLSGLSVQDAQITLQVTVPGRKKKQSIVQNGPILITHHGISGPASLRLSAFAAREFHGINYKGNVIINWAPDFGSAEEIEIKLWGLTRSSPKRNVSSSCPLLLPDNTSIIPRRLWSSLVSASEIEASKLWGDASKKSVRKLAQTICQCPVKVTGKGVFKEEFVTAGGVSLKDIDMTNMGSKRCKGVFACGEVIDVDGVTGGFNFMGCWSTGYVAGNGAADYVMAKHSAANMKAEPAATASKE